jgi:hypothetical protein
MARSYPYPLIVLRDGYPFRFGILLLLLFISIIAFGQNETEYEEVPVTFSYGAAGSVEITAVIKNEQAYLPVMSVFNFLKIKTISSAGLDSVQGFFIDAKADFLFDINHKQIKFSGKQYALATNDFIKTETDLYISIIPLKEVFALDCQFNFRHLSISLHSPQDLPVIRELKQKKLLDNLHHLTGEKKADTIVKSKFKWLQLGTADWSINATQERNRSDYLRANIIMGAMVLGGEANVNLTYYKGQPFDARTQFYRWRYVNNNLSLLHQIAIGRISTQNISSLSGPLNGVVVSNTPTNYRKAFGNYRYTGTTKPEWIVELYVNAILVNYVKADALGFYSFDIPMVYGNSAIQLKFYGPWGETEVEQENITIPYNFLPAGKMEYSLSSGMVQDENKSRFSRLSLNYGMNKRMTIGAGSEYLSSAMQGKPFPYMNASLRLGQRLIFNGEIAKGVRTKGFINYRFPSSIQLDVSYIKYSKDQTSISTNYREERKIEIAIPFKYNGVAIFSRLGYNMFILSKYRFTTAEWLLSASMKGITSTIKTNIQIYPTEKPFVYSNYSMSFRMLSDFRLLPQVQYQYNNKSFSLLKIEAEKKISHIGYINMAFEKSIVTHNSTFNLGLRFDLSFARVHLTTRQGNKALATTQSAYGSLRYGQGTGYTRFDNQNNIGKGGIQVAPFLDLNSNGRKEENEPRVEGLIVKVNGGKIEQPGDSTILITSLEAYRDYIIELDKNSFDNISWQIKRCSLKVTIQPNVFQVIEVPVCVMGEASGMVTLNNGKLSKGLSRIQLNFYDSSLRKVAQTLSEADGYFSFMGLTPGSYHVTVDSAQLELLHLTVFPSQISFLIKESVEGVVADGFEFKLQLRDTAKQQGEVDQGKKYPGIKILQLKPKKYIDSAREATSTPVKKENYINSHMVSALPTPNKKRIQHLHTAEKNANSPSVQSPGQLQKQWMKGKAEKKEGREMKKPEYSRYTTRMKAIIPLQGSKEKILHARILKLIHEQQDLIKEQKQLLHSIYMLRIEILKKRRPQ